MSYRTGSILLVTLLAVGCSTDKIGTVRDTPNKISPYDVDFDSKSFKYNREPSGENPEEEELLNAAQSAYDSSLYTLAREKWSQLKDNYPASFYVPFVELKIADSYFLGGDHAQAVSSYQEFIKLHPGHEAIPYVQLQIGKSYRQQFVGGAHDPTPLQNALKSFHVLTDNFPTSEYAAEGWKSIGECRELLAEYEFEVAQFYNKLDKKEAARARYAELLATYGDTNVVKENYDIISQKIDREANVVAAVDKPIKKDGTVPVPSSPNILLALNEPEAPTASPRSRASLRQPPNRLSGNQLDPDAPAPPIQLTCGESGSTRFASVVVAKTSAKLSVSESDASETTICLTPEESNIASQRCDLGQTKFTLEQSATTGCATLRYADVETSAKPTVISTSRPSRVAVILPKNTAPTPL